MRCTGSPAAASCPAAIAATVSARSPSPALPRSQYSRPAENKFSRQRCRSATSTRYARCRLPSSTVNDIEHIESTSLNGIAVEKIYFQPGVNIANAVAQVTAIAQTQLRQLPQGTTPPLVIQYNASSVPIIQ